METLRVLIVDDMTLVRQGIRSILRDEDAAEIVGEASDAREAADMVKTLEPDVVLLDQDMPGLDTSEIIALFKEQRAAVEVIVLSETADEEKTYRALEAGASGYVLKDITADILVRAMHEVCNGRTTVYPDVLRRLVERFRGRTQQRDRVYPNGLTPQELKILVEMAKGATDREIGLSVSIAESTVKSHVRSILRKLGARNRTQAVADILRRGLVR